MRADPKLSSSLTCTFSQNLSRLCQACPGCFTELHCPLLSSEQPFSAHAPCLSVSKNCHPFFLGQRRSLADRLLRLDSRFVPQRLQKPPGSVTGTDPWKPGLFLMYVQGLPCRTEKPLWGFEWASVGNEEQIFGWRLGLCRQRVLRPCSHRSLAM